MVKTIIFDFNGTLLDDLEINFEIFNLLAHDFNAREISLNEYLEVFDFPVIDCYRKWGFEVDDGKFTPIADRFHHYYNERVFERCKIFDNAYKLLEELKGKYRLVCLSATKKETLDAQLKHYNLFDYFDAVVGMDNKYAHGKVELAVSWLEMSKLNRDEIIFVGDTVHDKKVADAMKVKCILVCKGHNSKNKLKEVCDIVLDDITEIKKYLN